MRAFIIRFWVLIATLIFLLPWSAAAISNQQCLRCHGDRQLVKVLPDGMKVSLFTDANLLTRSKHAKLACVNCHHDIRAIPHDPKLAKADCVNCHNRENLEYRTSIHGKKYAQGDADVPRCQTCHGSHQILPVKDPRSAVFPSNLVKVCLRCHTDAKMTAQHSQMPGIAMIKSYSSSAHGKALSGAGLTVTAICTSCHGTHNMTPHDDPTSSVNKMNIPATCGKCHLGILNVYKESIHGKALLVQKIKDAPACTDCHGEHIIAASTEANSKVAPKNIPKTCSACHDVEGIVGKYGIASKRLETYEDSYHGTANKFGRAVVANCASCHGYHDIRPSYDPQSSISKANIPKTCGKCHPKASDKFAQGNIHIQATKESSPGVFYVRTFYIWFISILMVCFLTYMGFEIYGHLRRRGEKKHEPK